MKKTAFCVALWLVPTFVANAQQPPALPCMFDDVKCAATARLKSPTRNKFYWSAAFAKPLEQRFGTAPDELLIYLNLDNISAGYPNRPHAASLPADLQRDVHDAIAELPASLKQLIDKKLAGIYFVKDLGGTGYTDYVRGGWFSRDAGFIVLDMDVLEKQKANAWATWKENTPFKPDPAYKLETVIEAPGEDNRKNAIQYILLHELGHILSIGEKIHPSWEDRPKSEPNLDAFPFAKLSWAIDHAGDRYTSRFDAAFPERSDVVYYFGAKLDGKNVIPTYEKLQRTDFPTLYASTRPGDDFAESFASYVHTVLMKRPWEIRVFVDGKLGKTYRLCWEEKRCAEKRRLLEEFLGIKN